MHASRKKRRAGVGRVVLHHLKSKLTTGLLVVIPLGITIFILKFLFNFADGVLAPVMGKAMHWFHAEAEYVPGVGVITGLLVIYLAGLLTANFVGRKLMHLGDELLGRIPLVKSIYTSSKQLTNVLSQGNKDSGRKAVWIEFPCPGSYAVAFQTGVVPAVSGKEYAVVFVPTAPNPTGGYVLFIETNKVYPAAFGAEEAMKIAVSGGIVTPEIIRAAQLQ